MIKNKLRINAAGNCWGKMKSTAPFPSKFLKRNGGDDGTRTRGLCRDSESLTSIYNNIGSTDGNRKHWKYMVVGEVVYHDVYHGSAAAEMQNESRFRNKEINLGRHAAECRIRAHPHREEIERDFINWRSPEAIAKSFKLTNRASVYRHAHALRTLLLSQWPRGGTLTCSTRRMSRRIGRAMRRPRPGFDAEHRRFPANSIARYTAIRLGP